MKRPVDKVLDGSSVGWKHVVAELGVDAWGRVKVAVAGPEGESGGD